MRLGGITLRLCFLLASLAAANAQPLDYPAQRITLVVGFAAGGSVDAIARLIAEKLQERWGRPVVVERSAPADGPTLRFLTGLLNGLGEGGVPLVGAEQVDASPSLVPSWQSVQGMSFSIDQRRFLSDWSKKVRYNRHMAGSIAELFSFIKSTTAE